MLSTTAAVKEWLGVVHVIDLRAFAASCTVKYLADISLWLRTILMTYNLRKEGW